MSTMTPTMTLADAIAEHREKIAAINLESVRWQAEMQAHLQTAPRPELTQSLAAAQSAWNEGLLAHADAMGRLLTHDANKPTALDGVGAWAAKRGLLANEALAYESIKSERRAAVADAEQAVCTERYAAWVALKAETAQANESAMETASAAISRAILEVEIKKGAQGQAWHRRLVLENAVEALKPRPNPTLKVGK